MQNIAYAELLAMLAAEIATQTRDEWGGFMSFDEKHTPCVQLFHLRDYAPVIKVGIVGNHYVVFIVSTDSSIDLPANFKQGRLLELDGLTDSYDMSTWCGETAEEFIESITSMLEDLRENGY